MMSQILDIIDNEILTLFKDGELSIKRNEIIDFVSPIKEQLISSIRHREFSDLKMLLNDLFGVLFKHEYSYCKKLDSSYKKNLFHCGDFKIKISKLLLHIIEKPNESQYFSDRFLELIELNKKAINYFATLSTLSKDKRNLLISNRTGGWIKREWNQFGTIIQITEDLQGEIFANFGYGKSSYFYILIKYKGIPITTFTDYIKYEFVRSWEVITYTRKFYYTLYKNDKFGNPTRTVFINYEDWANLMSYVVSLANIPDSNREDFFHNYINQEFRTMIQHLEKMYTSENYIFYKNTEEEDGNIKEVPYTVGFKETLLSYKTEKIFGTLYFFKSFNSSFLTQNAESINSLHKLYSSQFPSMVKELDELRGLIPNFENRVTEAKENLKNFQDQNVKVYLLMKKDDKGEELYEEESILFESYLEQKNMVFVAEQGIFNLKATIRRVENYEKDYRELCETFSY